MTPRIAICAAAVIAALVAAPRPASAYQYKIDAWAAPIYHTTYYTSSGTHLFCTSNLVQTSYNTPDVAIVVKTDEGNYYAQTCGSDTEDACVDATSSDGVFEILVFATSWDRSATGDVVDSANGTIASGVAMSGNLYSVSVPLGTYSVYTAQTHYNYTSDTVLYLFDSSMNLISEDDDDGVKYQALLYKQALAPGDILLVAPYSPSEQGYSTILIAHTTRISASATARVLR